MHHCVIHRRAKSDTKAAELAGSEPSQDSDGSNGERNVIAASYSAAVAAFSHTPADRFSLDEQASQQQPGLHSTYSSKAVAAAAAAAANSGGMASAGSAWADTAAAAAGNRQHDAAAGRGSDTAKAAAAAKPAAGKMLQRVLSLGKSRQVASKA